MWRYNGSDRPPFAVFPKKGQESVWDYPRPPTVVRDIRKISVRIDDCVIAETRDALRVLETASAPTFYLPPTSVRMDLLHVVRGSSFCEWKGNATYFGIDAERAMPKRVAWCYPKPLPGYEAITGYLSFYPSILDCYVGDERARAQGGGFYGGWITSEIVGPIKGDEKPGHW